MEIENAAIDDHNGVSLPVFEYYKTLEKELHDVPENFRKLNLLLQDFKNKRIDRIGTVLKLRELLKHKLHLFDGFKKLLNEFDCVEGERTKAELAFLYACQVKDHFGNDERFHTFSVILTEFDMNKKTTAEVYEEMQELFGSHNELFEKFKKFYGVRPETMPLPAEPSKNQDGRKDCNKGEQNCNKSNLAPIKVNFVKPKLPCKRKCIRQEAGGSVNKAKSSQGDREAERERKERERKGKAPVVYDEVVPEHRVSERDDSVQIVGSAKAKGSRRKSARYLNQCKEELFKLEDERYEFDMLQSWVASAAKRANKLLKKIRRSKVKPDLLCLRRCFTPPNLRFIKDMYSNYGVEIIKILHEDPAKVLPVIHRRLKKKKRELLIRRLNLEMTWRESSNRLFRELQGT